MSKPHPLDITTDRGYAGITSRPSKRTYSFTFLAIFVLFNLWYSGSFIFSSSRKNVVSIPLHADEILKKCNVLHAKPGVPEDFYERVKSDRYEQGSTRIVLIRNARVWTGGAKGSEVVRGDVLLEGGIIKSVGRAVTDEELRGLQSREDVEIVDANGYVLARPFF